MLFDGQSLAYNADASTLSLAGASASGTPASGTITTTWSDFSSHMTFSVSADTLRIEGQPQIVSVTLDDAPTEGTLNATLNGSPSSDFGYGDSSPASIGGWTGGGSAGAWTYTANVNAEVGAGKEVSIKCESPASFVAERPMYFDYVGGGGVWSGGHDTVGAANAAYNWYFAEGYTGAGFDEWLCVLNPWDEAIGFTIYFQTQEEGEKMISGLTVQANSRHSFKVNDLLQGGSFQTSLRIAAFSPIVVERPMYYSYGGTGGWGWTGGHCVMGATSLYKSYYFAEGTTRAGFEEWLTLQNPWPTDITVNLSYQLQGATPINTSHVLPSNRRSTIYVPNEIGTNKDASVYITSDAYFLAERPMYFSYQGLGGWGWPGGHCVTGATCQSQNWFFAEGYTGAGFEEWICIQNPGGSDATVTITYYPEGGAPITKSHVVVANSRFTVPVNTDAGTDLAISAGISSNKPIIVERPSYFNFQGVCPGGHDVVGCIP